MLCGVGRDMVVVVEWLDCGDGEIWVGGEGRGELCVGGGRGGGCTGVDKGGGDGCYVV